MTIEFAYPYSHLFDVTYEKILPRFRELHPDIEVSFRATYEDYEDGTQHRAPRGPSPGELPDVTMQGLNRQEILVEKGIAKSLEPFIERGERVREGGATTPRCSSSAPSMAPSTVCRSRSRCRSATTTWT